MVARTLVLGDTLSLPADAITQTFGILAVRGAGKSNLAAVMAEEMFDAHLPFVVVDPVGSWWGLRSELAIPIFGGRHADVPLEKTGGALVADLVVNQRLTCVLDVSELSEGDKTRFLIDFAERLYRRNTEPLHLFLEEADDFCPQRPFHEQARLVRAWENVVRRGRARGLGITMITQRSAALNKNVLTQIETLFVLRTTSPQDRKAIEGWVQYHGQSRELLESLSSLAAGEAWVWSPSYLKTTERVRIRRRRTFDSGATPKSGSSRAPSTLADVDLKAVTKAMAATIERTKAEDPRELRKQIAELKAELARKPAAASKRVEVAILKGRDVKILERTIEVASSLSGIALELHAALAARQKSEIRETAGNARTEAAEFTISRYVKSVPAGGKPAPNRPPSAGDASLPLGERRVLTAIAQYVGGVTREQLTILTGYKRSSRNTYLDRLRGRGCIEVRGEVILVTGPGLDALGADFERLPTGDALREHWLTKLPMGERKVLGILCDEYPRDVERVVIEEKTGYSRSSSNTYLQRLGARQLVDSVGRGSVRASKELFA